MNKLLYIMLICIMMTLPGCAHSEESVKAQEEEMKLDESTQDCTIKNLREHYTTIKGNGEDQVTIMVYMIGSDLEADGVGRASKDIAEMLKADLGTNINLVLETGGTTSWKNTSIKGGTCQRFIIKDGKLNEKADLGCINMVEPNSVTDFIKWGSKTYPANRYELIFWDHGGGTAMGYGCDMYYINEMLELPEIGKALKESGVEFDFIGFDACLMGTIETAYMLSNYGDYMIASEETEPGSGWEYTKWLNAISQNPSIATIDLGEIIVDDFVSGLSKMFEKCTLSVVELREIPYTYKVLCEYMANSTVVLENYGFKYLSTARATAKDFGEGNYEQIDIIDYIKKAEVQGGDTLKQAIESAVKYTDNNTSDVYGLAMYYPYNALEHYEKVSKELASYGYGGACKKYFDEFVSILAGGQRRSSGIKSKIEALTGETGTSETIDYTQYSWYSPEVEENYEPIYAATAYKVDEFIDEGKYYILPMSPESWKLITNVEQQVFIDDGKGYIDLGSNNIYEVDEKGNLKVAFDKTWVAINGRVVPFYIEKEGGRGSKDWYAYGYVPAMLNHDEAIEMILCWDDAHENGYVAGYRAYKEEMAAAGKGLKQFKKGDKIDFICDYYTYEGKYKESYYLGAPIRIDKEPLAVSKKKMEDETAEVCLKLTDIYQNSFWTEAIRYEIKD